MVANLPDSVERCTLVVRTAPAEVDKRILQHTRLQCGHVAALKQQVGLAPYKLIRSVGDKLVDNRVGQRTHNQNWTCHYVVELLYADVAGDLRLLLTRKKL